VKCEDVRATLLAGETDAPERMAVEAHLAGCRACRSDQPLIDRLRTVLASPSLWEEPSSDLGDRIVRSLQRRRESPDRVRVGRWAAAAAAALVLTATGFGLMRFGSAAPDWTLDLALVEPVPNAVAVVDGWVTDTGTRMVIEISGIDEAPDGHYYEIWLTALNGRHVSAGTFTGPGTVTAFAGVRRADFPRLWITLESVDGELGPSSETYFDTPK
jgi:anti-sigma factor RsiW